MSYLTHRYLWDFFLKMYVIFFKRHAIKYREGNRKLSNIILPNRVPGNLGIDT